jgi:hypothetical protein
MPLAGESEPGLSIKTFGGDGIETVAVDIAQLAAAWFVGEAGDSLSSFQGRHQAAKAGYFLLHLSHF